jgi:heptosyltransferase-2
MIQVDCIYYLGEIPCKFHKKYQVECNEYCKYYKKIGKRILIIKKDALGDVLRTTPILHSIKDKYGEDVYITWLTTPNAVALLENNLFIQRIYQFDFKSVLQLEVEEFDILFNLDKDKPALALAEKVSAKEKYGFTMNKTGNLTTFDKNEQYAHRLGISDNLKRENIKSYQQIIKELLKLPYSKEYKYILNIPQKEKMIENLSNKYNINRDSIIIGFVTGAGSKFLTKIWPKDYFIELGLRLIKKENYTVLLFGAESERELNLEIFNRIQSKLNSSLKPKIINTGNKNTLLDFAALISLCNLIVTGDTLGLHLAISLQIPSISFYGPTSASEIDLYETGIKIIADSECLLCYKKNCDREDFCLLSIKPEEVFKKIMRLLNK